MTTTNETFLLNQFLSDNCEFSQCYSVKKGSFYDAYSRSVTAKGATPLHINDVGRALKAMPLIEDSRTKVARIWKGIRLCVEKEAFTPSLNSFPEAVKPEVEEPEIAQVHEPFKGEAAVDALVLRAMGR